MSTVWPGAACHRQLTVSNAPTQLPLTSVAYLAILTMSHMQLIMLVAGAQSPIAAGHEGTELGVAERQITQSWKEVKECPKISR